MDIFELTGKIVVDYADAVKGLKLVTSETSTTKKSLENMDSSAGNTKKGLNDLGGTADDASDSLKDMTDSGDDAADGMDDLGDATDDANDTFDDLGDTTDDAADTLDDLADTTDDVGDSLDDVEDGGKDAGDAIEDAGDAADDADGKFSTWGVTLGNLAASVITGLISKVGELASDIMDLGMETETSFAKLETIAGTENIDDLTDSISELSKETGVSSSELANVAYNAISAGASADTAMEMVESATQLATAGFTDADSALSVLSTAMNSYGDAAGTAEEISDSLIQTQNLGVTTIDELSKGIGKAIATGSAYSVNLNNIESGYISLTKNGIKTEEATTYLNSMFNELGDSGSDVSAILQEQTGESFTQLMEDGYSLGDVLGILYDYCDNDATALKNLWSSSEAGLASNAIVQQGLEAFNENLEAVANSAGATETAYETMADTTATKIAILQANFEDLGLQIYDSMNEPLGEIIDTVTESVIPTLQGVVDALAPVITTVMTELIPPLMELIDAVLPVICDLIVQIIPPLTEIITAVIPVLVQLIEMLMPFLTQIIEAVLPVLVDMINALLPLLQPLLELIQPLLDLVIAILEPLLSLIDTILTPLISVISAVAEIISAVLSPVIEAISTVISTLLNPSFESISTVVDTVISGVTSGFQSAKNTLTSIFNAIKSVVSTVFNAIKSVVSTVINSVKNVISTGLNGAKNVVTNVLGGIKEKFTSIFDNVKNTVKNAIEKIKGFFKFDVSLPSIKLPHFSISPSGWKLSDLLQGSIPKLGIEWYAKAMDEGMVMTQPTVFGYNASNGSLLAGGEAGSETVVGTESLLSMINSAVMTQNAELVNVLDKILDALEKIYKDSGGDIVIPVYIGNERLDELIIKSKQRLAKRSGGMSYA